MFLVSKMGSMTSQFSTVLILLLFSWGYVCQKYRKSPFIEKMTNFRIKWRKCEDLQHLGCWNLVCSIILGCYKKYMWGFWKFWFFGHFGRDKIRFLVKNGQNRTLTPQEMAKKWKSIVKWTGFCYKLAKFWLYLETSFFFQKLIAYFNDILYLEAKMLFFGVHIKEKALWPVCVVIFH